MEIEEKWIKSMGCVGGVPGSRTSQNNSQFNHIKSNCYQKDDGKYSFAL